MAPLHGGKGRGDLYRVVDGISLVFVESFRRLRLTPSASPSACAIGRGRGGGGGGGEMETLIRQTLKRAVLSATDLAGITSGRIVRHPSVSLVPTHDSISNSTRHQSQSIVFFSDGDDVNSPGITKSVFLVENEKNSEDAAANDIAQSPVIHQQQFPDNSTTKTTTDHPKFQDDDPSRSAPPPLTIATVNCSFDCTENESDTTSIYQQVQAASSTIKSIPIKRRLPRERRVPSTPLGRALGFAGLGAGLAWGTLQESAKRILYGTPQSNAKHSAVSPFLSDQNAERLALALCRMRGAALKLGQMLSIQDESLVPAPVLAALDIVRQGADVMPRSQLNDVLDSELGRDWTKRLKSFDYEPLAAASIGQVHRAVMKDGLEVAMKIQYPGVADSIDSDIENVRRLLDYTNLIPKGLFLDRAIKVAKEELSRECDYELESRNQKRFRDLLSETEGVYVPMVIDEISSKKVLTTELVSGIPIDKVAALSQEVRNHVGRKLLELTLRELFVFRFMQTDPNWSNFLYEESTNMINLIDFGAAHEYRKGFVDDYLRMVLACADRDRDAIIEMSTRLGFLTGIESEVMLDAHVQASFIVGLPFSSPGAYDFRASNITSSIAHLGATMLKHRLTPPPDEAYSLHRKLSGAFLACIKLGVIVPCRDLLLQVHQQYHFSDENEETFANSVS